MGQEIHSSHFDKRDFQRFAQRLEAETQWLKTCFDERQLSQTGHICGAELELWLVDQGYQPTPINEVLLKQLNHPLLSPELSRFNIELNTTPMAIQGRFLSRLESEIGQTLADCEAGASRLDSHVMMFGIPPHLDEALLTLDNMSPMVRYKALNEQVLRTRQGKPLAVDIKGEQQLHLQQHNVMLEAAATSLQLHLQLTQEQSRAYYNASVIASAPLVAVSANSPFLFGKTLWHETRIPVFEQSVAAGGFADAAFGPIWRVGFGSDYVRNDLFELFAENLAHYPVLLPEQLSDDVSRLEHLRLHNGTIWRWNRPLVGFDDDGTPHLRIEQRVIPAGPTVKDIIANAAFYYGLVQALVSEQQTYERQISFAVARDNFYNAARYGLKSHIECPGFDHHVAICQVIEERFLPMAEAGLRQLAVDEEDIRYYLGIIEQRCRRMQNGALWQLGFVAKHGEDWLALVREYDGWQRDGRPVHEWEL